MHGLRSNEPTECCRGWSCPPPVSRQAFRCAGVASRLVGAAVQRAAEAGLRAVYLHVIAYNAPAIAFYRRLGFCQLALLPDFYIIRRVAMANVQVCTAQVRAAGLVPPAVLHLAGVQAGAL